MLSGFVATLGLVATLFQAPAGPQNLPPDMFRNVDPGHWLYTESDKLSRAGVFGWSMQSPIQTHPFLTRYEFAVCLDRSLRFLRASSGKLGKQPKKEVESGKALGHLSVGDLETLIRLRKELRQAMSVMMPAKELAEYDRMLTDALGAARSGTPQEPRNGAEVSLNDLRQGHWAFASVSRLKKLDLINGYPDGHFRGNRVMSRDEMAAALSRVLRYAWGDPPRTSRTE